MKKYRLNILRKMVDNQQLHISIFFSISPSCQRAMPKMVDMSHTTICVMLNVQRNGTSWQTSTCTHYITITQHSIIVRLNARSLANAVFFLLLPFPPHKTRRQDTQTTNDMFWNFMQCK